MLNIYILIHLKIGSRGILKNEMSTPSGNSNNNNIHNSFKMTPPVLTKEYRYSKRKGDLSVWEALSSLEKNKQGLAGLLSLTGQDKQAVRTISVENLGSIQTKSKV